MQLRECTQKCWQKYTRDLFTNLDLQQLEIGYPNSVGFFKILIPFEHETKTKQTKWGTIEFPVKASQVSHWDRDYDCCYDARTTV